MVILVCVFGFPYSYNELESHAELERQKHDAAERSAGLLIESALAESAGLRAKLQDLRGNVSPEMALATRSLALIAP